MRTYPLLWDFISLHHPARELQGIPRNGRKQGWSWENNSAPSYLSGGKELPDEMRKVASPLSVCPSPSLSAFSSKCRARKAKKILKFHIKTVWGSFGNTQNVRSKLQQQQRDFTDVFHIEEKKKISFQHQLQEAESSLFPKAAVPPPKSPS